MYHSFFICSSVYGHLGCFHVLATVNSAVMNIGVQVCLFELWFSKGACPVVGLLGHIVVLSCFLRNLHTVFHSSMDLKPVRQSEVRKTNIIIMYVELKKMVQMKLVPGQELRCRHKE